VEYVGAIQCDGGDTSSAFIFQSLVTHVFSGLCLHS
jgi:hypothetical protein